ncbi:MAG: hypothetical protein NTU48_02425 [Legionellales bacterium]|nr:hypothetical protein [Legionellales bacterium]
MLRDVQPIPVEQNRSTLLYCAFLVFISVFHSQAKMIKYPDLVEDIRTDLGKLFPKHQ